MSVLIDIKTKQRIEFKPKAISDCGNHYKVYIPTCHKYQTIDHTNALLSRQEPLEPCMQDRVDSIYSLDKPVVIVEYKLGDLYNESL